MSVSSNLNSYMQNDLQIHITDLYNACVWMDLKLVTEAIDRIKKSDYLIQDIINMPIQEDGATLFHIACQRSTNDIVDLFIQNGANPYIVHGYGMSAIEVVCESRNIGVLEVLEKFYKSWLMDYGFKARLVDISDNDFNIKKWAYQIKFDVISSGGDEVVSGYSINTSKDSAVSLYGGPVGDTEFLRPEVDEDDFGIWFSPLGAFPLAFGE